MLHIDVPYFDIRTYIMMTIWIALEGMNKLLSSIIFVDTFQMSMKVAITILSIKWKKPKNKAIIQTT